MNNLTESRIFQRLEQEASVEQRALIATHTESARQRLKLIRDTFPSYTLHDETHVLNVIAMMEVLLVDKITSLTPLECALLILSAYYHDMGMVFTEEEKKNMASEQRFDDFLKEYPDVYVQLHRYQETITNQIPDNIAEKYCRWAHPQRSFDYVDNLPDLQWDGHTFNRELALICQSHGYDITLHQTREGLTNDFFQGKADLLFCSILLRLGDILDFDNTRTPDEIYKYLGISKRETPREKKSDIEWIKHISSQGFNMDKDKKELVFAATCLEPAVEHDIREFVCQITDELRKCKSLLSIFSNRWKDFSMPIQIETKDIQSKGYKYGEYKFTLEQDQILQLLMGENLYSDAYAFIRELAQNSIDTTRHREIHEKSKGKSDFKPEPIVFSTWIDEDGYTWVRVDDYGMGMDEAIISEYLLRVGKSYYKSPRFHAEQYEYKLKKGVDFVPISCFGIGILSCFIVADRVELSTKRVDSGNDSGIRMKMNDLSSYFVLKLEHEKHQCDPLPCADNGREKYRPRNNYGTSIAVRLNPRKEKGDFDLKKILNKYIVVSPVPITFMGNQVGLDYYETLEKEWCDKTEYVFPEDAQKKIAYTIRTKRTAPMKFVVAPLNLTKYSPSDCFKGQAICMYLDNGFDMTDRYQVRLEAENRIEFTSLKSHATLEIEYREYSDYEKKELRSTTLHKLKETIEDITQSSSDVLYDKVRNLVLNDEFEKNEVQQLVRDMKAITEQEYSRLVYDICRYLGILSDLDLLERSYSFTPPDEWTEFWRFSGMSNHLLISHNGVKVPITYNISSYQRSYKHIHFPVINANLAFSDSLLPDLSLSREQLRCLSWDIYSIVNYSFFKSIKAASLKREFFQRALLSNFIESNNENLGSFLTDKLLDPFSGWAEEPIFKVDGKFYNVIELRELNEKQIVEPSLGPSWGFIDKCRAILTQIGLCVRLMEDEIMGIISNDLPFASDALKLYPPLFFIKYVSPRYLRYKDNHLNVTHHFSKWLIENTIELSSKHPSIFERIIHIIDTPFYRKNPQVIAGEINTLLKRLQSLKFEGIKSAVFIKDSDFLDEDIGYE